MRKVHVISVDYDGTKKALQTLEYEIVEDMTITKLKEYMDEKDYFFGCNALKFDEQTTRDLIIYYANKNNYINWELDYNKIKVKTLFNALKRKEIFINRLEDGIGGIGNIPDFIDFVKKIIKHLIELFKYLSYKKMIEHTGYSKDFIISVIYGVNKKRIGFISNKDFAWKNWVEHFIMKDLGYKKKNGEWIYK